MHIYRFTLTIICLLTIKTNCISQNLLQGNFDTVYLFDYFYAETGSNYRGKTTVFLPNGDSVALQTKAVQIMPVDFNQYAMLRIIIPKDSSIKLNVRFTAYKRKLKFEHVEEIVLKKTRRTPSLWFGRILIENCGKRNIANCPFIIRNSDQFSRRFVRYIIERNIEKGVTHIYNAVTGELYENPVFYN